MKSKPLCLYIKTSIWTTKRIQSKCFFVTKLRLRIMITCLLSSYCTWIVIKENIALFSLPPFKNKLSKQLIISVNRLCHVQLKKSGEEDCSNEVGGYFSAGEAKSERRFGPLKKIQKKELSDKNCFEKAWWQEKKLLTLTIWCFNLKTEMLQN